MADIAQTHGEADVAQVREAYEKKIANLQRKLDKLRTSYAVTVMGERFSQFMESARLTLPRDSFAEFVAKCKAASTDADAFLAELAADNYRELYESLFAMEMDYARAFNHAKLRTAFTFDKGKGEIAMAERLGKTVQEMKANEYRINREFFDKFLPDRLVPERPLSIIEIGGAWGGATHYFVERFKPVEYHVYDIDDAWCDWLEKTFGVIAKTCDGETLSETAGGSMDIALCSSAFYFMPMEKQWSYMLEMARVLKGGGIAIFNARVVDRLSPSWLKDYMVRNFPKRNFGLIAQHCLNTAFPASEFDCVSNEPLANRGHVIYRRK